VRLLVRFSRSLPDYTAPTSAAGISGPVEIVRDNANVPHIFGATDADVFFGLGFAHAQDRLWQMTMLRRTAQGRLSEVFGRAHAAHGRADAAARPLALAQSSVAAQDAYDAAALEAYARGVNAWLRQVNDRGARARRARILPLSARDRALAAGRQHRHRQADGAAGCPPSRAEVLRARVSLVLPDERVARHPARRARGPAVDRPARLRRPLSPG
jgi:penicillin G amidase